MAAVAIDPLEYVQLLESAGMPRAQAEVVVRGFTSMFIHNFDALVTKDYLEARFAEFETRMELRFKDVDAKMDIRFSEVDAKFGKLYIMCGIIIASTVIPVLQKLFAWLG